MSKTKHWMPFYIADYLADTTRLTTEQHGAYLLLIMDYWRNGPLPDDDAILAQVTRLAPAVWANHRQTLARFFSVSNDEWRHKRIDEELKEATEKADKHEERARKAAGARWGKQEDNASSNAKEMLEHCPSPSPSHSHSPSHSPEGRVESSVEEETAVGAEPPQADDSTPHTDQVTPVHNAAIGPEEDAPRTHGSAKDADGVFITLPLNTGKEHPITAEQVAEWFRLYPAVDVHQELRNMRGWLIANPNRRKTRKGVDRFINGWLSREQDRDPPSHQHRRSSGPPRSRQAELEARNDAALEEWLQNRFGHVIEGEVDSNARH